MILIKKVHLNQNKLEMILLGISHEIRGNQLIFKNQMLIRLRLRKKSQILLRLNLKCQLIILLDFIRI